MPKRACTFHGSSLIAPLSETEFLKTLQNGTKTDFGQTKAQQYILQ
jgi:hypothetical protein